MNYLVRIEQVESRETAVVRRRASLEELTQVVPRACGEVWEFLRSFAHTRTGRNLALYLDDEFHLEVGVEVFEPINSNEQVVSSSTPAGTVATALHTGPYHRLPEAHRAIRLWCEEQGIPLAGPNWELYGPWKNDPTELRTDVYYLLSPSGESAGKA